MFLRRTWPLALLLVVTACDSKGICEQGDRCTIKESRSSCPEGALFTEHENLKGNPTTPDDIGMKMCRDRGFKCTSADSGYCSRK